VSDQQVTAARVADEARAGMRSAVYRAPTNVWYPSFSTLAISVGAAIRSSGSCRRFDAKIPKAA